MSETLEVPKMRIGLIGCGEIGALRAAAVSRVGGWELTVLSDVDLERASRLAGRHGGQVERDWHSLVRRADLDAIIVSTPPHLHAEISIEMLAAGKHVLCEKPLARTPSECRAIVNAAREHNRVLATGFNYRFYPSIRKAREIFDSGLIGELDHIRSYAGYSASDHSHSWIHDAGVMGGGALRDNGIHLIDLTRYFLGDVVDVVGFSQETVWGFEGCEDNGFALLRNWAGQVATLQASWTEWKGFRFQIEIYGTKGCIRASCFPMLTHVVWADKPGGKPRSKRHFFPMTHIMEHLRSYRWVVVQSFTQELELFARAIAGKPTELATGSDGLRAVEIADRVAASSSSSAREAYQASAN